MCFGYKAWPIALIYAYQKLPRKQFEETHTILGVSQTLKCNEEHN
jgi:hypothetical protein